VARSRRVQVRLQSHAVHRHAFGFEIGPQVVQSVRFGCAHPFDFVVIVQQDRVGIGFVRPLKAQFNVVGTEFVVKDRLGQSPVGRQTLVAHVPGGYATAEMGHDGKNVTLHGVSHCLWLHGFQQFGRTHQVPHQDVTLYFFNVVLSTPIDYAIGLVKVVASQTMISLQLRSIRAKMSPFQVVFNHVGPCERNEWHWSTALNSFCLLVYQGYSNRVGKCGGAYLVLCLQRCRWCHLPRPP